MSSAPTRTVLVTGAARRLGREIALGLAAGGWQVAVHLPGIGR
jgi:NAD(P)-dependent dehydrogenase (short-subunit alcohol dehydrogenase family)